MGTYTVKISWDQLQECLGFPSNATWPLMLKKHSNELMNYI